MIKRYEESGFDFDNSVGNKSLNDTIAITKLKNARNSHNIVPFPSNVRDDEKVETIVSDDTDITTGNTTSLMDFHRSRYGRSNLRSVLLSANKSPNEIHTPTATTSIHGVGRPAIELTSSSAEVTEIHNTVRLGRNSSYKFLPQPIPYENLSTASPSVKSPTKIKSLSVCELDDRCDQFATPAPRPTPTSGVLSVMVGSGVKLEQRTTGNIDRNEVDDEIPVPSSSTRPVSADSGRGSSSVMRSCLLANMEPNVSRSAGNFPMQSALFDEEGLQQRKNTLKINGKMYQVLNILGKGGSCVVHQVYNEEMQKCFAVKCVDLSDADEVVVRAYKNEISLLERLQSTNRVVKMFDYEYVPQRQTLYVVMEKGDADLATFFRSRGKNRLSDLTISFYWSEMLEAVKVVHEQGIVHSDLKPRNFLLVGGHLVLIDFGIANAVPSNKTSITKDCQMGTPNYMSPEALSNFGDPNRLKFKVGVKSDVWSLGVILYNMVYGVTPFQHIPDQYKFMAITNTNFKIDFKSISDEYLLDVMKRCLERDPKRRATVKELLEHPYLTHKRASIQIPPKTTNITEENLKSLAEAVSQNTPKSNAKLLKVKLS